jgi:NAD(P)H-flavin reductase
MFDTFEVKDYCTDAAALALPEMPLRLAVFIPVFAVVMTSLGLLSFKLGKHTLASFVMMVYFVIVGMLAAGWTCMNWATYVDIVLLSIVFITLITFWSRPAFLRPGGLFEKLMFSRVRNQTGPEQDTILFGKKSDYDFTWGTFVYILMFITWCVVHVAERYTFYSTLDMSSTRALGKAIAHAMIRLHWFAEISGARNLPMWVCTGMAYERLIALHKIAGRTFLPLALIHMGCLMATFDEHGDLPGHQVGDSFSFTRVNVLFGFLAMLMFIGLIATSIPSWRRDKFENFYWNHFNFKFLMMVMMLLHMRAFVFPFTITLVLGFYFDTTLRFIAKGVYTCELDSAELVCDDEKTKTEVVKLVISRSTWPGGPWNHEAGDYVMLSFGSKDSKTQPITKWLNPLSFRETTPIGGPPLGPAFLFHPYTISSPPDAASNKVTIMLKNMGEGTWSDQVCKMVKDESCNIKLVNPHMGGCMGRLSIQPAEYETVILCGGGIGITPLCAIWSDIAKKHTVGRTKRVVVIWSAPTAKLFGGFQEFINLASACTTGVEFVFKGFVTKGTEEESAGVVAGMELVFGKRPSWDEEIAAACGKTSAAGYSGVLACGPESAMQQITGAVVKIDSKGGSTISDVSANARGKVHLHKETFEW